MGYTTWFTGRFELSRPLTDEERRDYGIMVDMLSRHAATGLAGSPSGYLQWRISSDGCGVEWDQEEKFYDYINWLSWIVMMWFSPRGIALSGTVWYRGESADNIGRITVSHHGITTESALGPGVHWRPLVMP